MNLLRSRVSLMLVSLGLAASAVAQPAQRSFSNYYFFGDSLTDNGNLFAATGSPPPPYFQGRVSNGITYAEYLAPGLVAALTTTSNPARLNFAFAGATATTGVVNPPNLAMQIGLYQSRGITANPNGLYVVLAGANDLLNGVQVPANQNATGMTNIGVGASTAVTGAVQSLAGLGAKNILVLNLPDISRTPRFTTGSGAPAALFMQNGVLAYNRDLTGRIGALPLAPDVRVTVFDLSAIFNQMVLTPQRFGFTITNQEFLGILGSGGNPGDVNNYIFWDGIHPTTKAHAVFAQVLTEVLNPEFVLGSAAVQGTAVLAASDLSSDAIAARLDQVRAAGSRPGAQAYVSYSHKDGSRDFTGYQNGFSYTGSVFTAGFDLSLGADLVAGLALTKDTLDSDLAAGAGSFELEGQSVSVYGQWKAGALFADASAGYGSHDIRDISRRTMFGGMMTAGKTDGDRWGGMVRVGAGFVSDSLRVTPFAGLRYTKAEIGTYTETGVGGLNFAFEKQTAKSVDGLLGATADWQMVGGENPVFLGLSAMFQKDFADDTRSVAGRLAETVAARNTISVRDGLDQSIKLGARVGGAIGKRWGWSAGYMAEMRDDGDTASQYSVSIQTGF